MLFRQVVRPDPLVMDSHAYLDSCESSIKAPLQLPSSCEPPPAAGPTKQLVWIVCYDRFHNFSIHLLT